MDNQSKINLVRLRRKIGPLRYNLHNTATRKTDDTKQSITNMKIFKVNFESQGKEEQVEKKQNESLNQAEAIEPEPVDTESHDDIRNPSEMISSNDEVGGFGIITFGSTQEKIAQMEAFNRPKMALKKGNFYLAQKKLVTRKMAELHGNKYPGIALVKYSKTVDSEPPALRSTPDEHQRMKTTNEPKKNGSFMFELGYNEDDGQVFGDQMIDQMPGHPQTFYTEPKRDKKMHAFGSMDGKFKEEKAIEQHDPSTKQASGLLKKTNGIGSSSLSSFRPSRTLKKLVFKESRTTLEKLAFRKGKKSKEGLKKTKESEKYSNFIELQKKTQAKGEARNRHKVLISKSSTSALNDLKAIQNLELKAAKGGLQKGRLKEESKGNKIDIEVFFDFFQGSQGSPFGF